MNVGEASDVQLLVGWLVDPHQQSVEDADAARDAAARLADRAWQRLGAGLRSGDVVEVWDQLLTGCEGCPECTGTAPAWPAAESVAIGGDRR